MTRLDHGDADRVTGAGRAPLHASVDNPGRRARTSGWSGWQRWILCLVLFAGLGTPHAGEASLYARRDSWVATLIATRAALERAPFPAEVRADAVGEIQRRLENDFPVESDWWRQDSDRPSSAWFAANRGPELEIALLQRALDPGPSGPGPAEWRAELDRLRASATAVTDPAWLRLYVRACEWRRQQRLETLRRRWPRIVFAKHYNLGGSHYAYTEGQSDAQNERTFVPGAALCLLDLGAPTPAVHTLLDDPQGVIRDPDVSWDGRRILFAWKKADRHDDYHLYEYDTQLARVRPLTRGLGFADYEGVYLPNGDLVFNSTRCVQTVDCWWTEVSNLYTCDPDGGRLRRLTFDQVHDNYPSVLEDGRVLYTRWEYNDRGQVFVQGLFQMGPDGTGQTEFYGNNSWFPTALLHARGIPGTRQAVAVFAGHHTLQAGKLGVVDPARGRQENQGAQLIAPLRATDADRVDAYGQEGELFQNPYPLSATEFLVAYAPDGWSKQPTRFKLYWFHADGRRELLTADPRISCTQPVPLAARTPPPVRHSPVDFRQETGVYAVSDVYAGPGLAGVPRGTVRRLRVIALGYRAAGIGWNYNTGPAGSALASTPVALGNGSWDVKLVLGDAEVYPDGSACFLVPARTPVYFQAIDEQGCAVQTMRSWSTLQPGEIAACVGCHEPKNQSPPLPTRLTLAARAGPQPLAPFYGPPRGFSFSREIQPILDSHCVRCHHDSTKFADLVNRTADAGAGWADPAPRLAVSWPDPPPAHAAASGAAPPVEVAFSLRDNPVLEPIAGRRWTEGYLALAQARRAKIGGEECYAGVASDLVNWVGAQSVPGPLPPYFRGAACSRLLRMLAAGHHGVTLAREEIDKLACWIDLMVPFCGDYAEANAWSDEQARTYVHFLDKRRTMEELEQQTLDALRASAATESAAR